MKIKLQIALTDGTWLEGESDNSLDPTTDVGIYLNEVHRSRLSVAMKVKQYPNQRAGTVPLAKRVFVPMSGILFIVKEE